MVLDFITIDKQLYLLILNNDLSVQLCHWKDLLVLNITLTTMHRNSCQGYH